MIKQNNFLVVHSGSGIGMGGIERVNYEILNRWNEVCNLEIVPFQPKKNISSVLMYLRRIRDSSIKSTVFMHLGLTKFLLLGVPTGSVKVFLHGIESWKKLPAWHKYVLKRVDNFISNSQFTWERFLQFNPEFAGFRNEVVHLGIGEPTEYQDPFPNVPAALIIGRMSKAEDYKGHRELIAVWPDIRKVVPNAELWIAGAGDLKPDLEKLAKGQDGIRFFGKVSEEEKQDLLRRCRCFAMPSKNEGFGLVYLEAMRLGRPCLVSSCDAGREVIGYETPSFILNANESSGIFQILIKIFLDASFCRQLSIAMYNRYCSSFTSLHFLQRFSSKI
jgi:phosphatidylinositol alpha-1,6-mannosyltransferase